MLMQLRIVPWLAGAVPLALISLASALQPGGGGVSTP